MGVASREGEGGVVLQKRLHSFLGPLRAGRDIFFSFFHFPAPAGGEDEVQLPQLPGGFAQLQIQVGPLLQNGLRRLERLQRVQGLPGQLRFGRLFPYPLLQTDLRRRAHLFDLRADPLQIGQQLVHLLLVFVSALLLPAAVVLHHQIGDGGEHASAGEAAPAHGHPLEDPGDPAVGQIVPATAVEAAEIQGLFPHPAGAEALAGFPVRNQDVLIQGLPAQLYWFE